MRVGGESGAAISYQNTAGETTIPTAGIMLGSCNKSLVQNTSNYSYWTLTTTIKVFKETLPYVTIPPRLFKGASDSYCGGTYTQTVEIVQETEIAELGTYST